MTRDKQLKLIRKCLTDLGVEQERLVDCSTIVGIKEDYQNSFLGAEIDTIFYCEESDNAIDSNKKEIPRYNGFYCVEYPECHVYFNASPYMQLFVDKHHTSPHPCDIPTIHHFPQQ